MEPRKSAIRILVDSLADEGLVNAQMTSAREIIRRLDPEKFHVTVFHFGRPSSSIAQRPNTRLIGLPRRRQTIRILSEFIFGHHQILFYMKASPASKAYLRLRRIWKDGRVTIGTIESQCDAYNEPTINLASIRRWEKTVLRCDFLFSNSQSAKKSLQSEYGLASQVLPTGVDTKFFIPAVNRPPNARSRILFVGSLRPFKQPDVLLDAAAVFPQSDFVIVGDGLMAAELCERVRRENFGNVIFLKGLSEEALRQQYQQADIFLFPSKWEGSPKVILEAAACGVPVIARNNYTPETVVDGVTGYTVSSDEQLYARLRNLLESPLLRRDLGHAGRLHSEKFDWDVLTRRWEEIFVELAAGRANGGSR